jgi:lipopolysaccharide/colanic/teichoic acid biosynthesis glycosyltransferase
MESKLAFSESMPEAGVITSGSVPVWSCSYGKRLFDLCIATPLLLVSLPAMLVAALVIKCASRGPVLFRQNRVGRNGKIFQILKFRTMAHRKCNVGPGVTRRRDPRIFPAGHWLRRWKLDELPQFFNVVRGDMSLVGPRPDLPGYMAILSAEQREILSLRPGITGAATLQFRHEEDLLAQVPAQELAHVYTSRQLPEKIRIDMAYARNANLFSDVKLLLRTVATILS